MRCANTRHAQFVVLLAITLVMIFPRVWHLESKSLWFDEAASWRTSSFSPSEMLRSLAGNVHTPLMASRPTLR